MDTPFRLPRIDHGGMLGQRATSATTIPGVFAMSPGNDDYYGILGVDRDATPDEIKRRFKEKAKGCHPDLHPDDIHAQERFVRLNKAYDILIHPDARRAIDAGHCEASSPATPRAPTTTSIFSRVAVHPARSTVSISRTWQVGHEWQGHQVAIPVHQSSAACMPGFGTLVETACPSCRGSGILLPDAIRCRACGGRGWIRVAGGNPRTW